MNNCNTIEFFQWHLNVGRGWRFWQNISLERYILQADYIFRILQNPLVSNQSGKCDFDPNMVLFNMAQGSIRPCVKLHTIEFNCQKPWLKKNSHTLLKRLPSLGIMVAQLTASLKPLNTVVLWLSEGFQGEPSVRPPWCRETSIFQSDRNFAKFMMNIHLQLQPSLFRSQNGGRIFLSKNNPSDSFSN